MNRREYLDSESEIAEVLKNLFTRVVASGKAAGINVESVKSVELYLLEKTDLPLLGVGESTRRIDLGVVFYRMLLTINKPDDYVDPGIPIGLGDLFKGISSNSHFPALITEGIVDLQPGQEVTLSMEIVVKSNDSDVTRMFSQTEKLNLARLAELNLKTVCCIYPPKQKVFLPADETERINSLITILVPGLNPLNMYRPEDLFIEEGEMSIFEKLFVYLGKMHKGLLTHGDTQLRNLMYKQSDGEVYALDLEHGVDFAAALRERDEYKGELKVFFSLYGQVLQQFDIPLKSENLAELFVRAVEWDLERIALSTVDAVVFSEEVKSNVDKALNTYLDIVADTELLTGLDIQALGRRFGL